MANERRTVAVHRTMAKAVGVPSRGFFTGSIPASQYWAFSWAVHARRNRPTRFILSRRLMFPVRHTISVYRKLTKSVGASLRVASVSVRFVPHRSATSHVLLRRVLGFIGSRGFHRAAGRCSCQINLIQYKRTHGIVFLQMITVSVYRQLTTL